MLKNSLLHILFHSLSINLEYIFLILCVIYFVFSLCRFRVLLLTWREWSETKRRRKKCGGVHCLWHNKSWNERSKTVKEEKKICITFHYIFTVLLCHIFHIVFFLFFFVFTSSIRLLCQSFVLWRWWCWCLPPFCQNKMSI